MSEIQKAFEVGDYALVRQLAAQKPSAASQQILERIKIDPKVIWIGLFGFLCTLLAAIWLLQ